MNLNRLWRPKYHLAEAVAYLPNATVYSGSTCVGGGAASTVGLLDQIPQSDSPALKLYSNPMLSYNLAVTASNLTANCIYAMPFVLGRSTLLREISILVNAVGATESQLKCYIYESSSSVTLAEYPGNCVQSFSPLITHVGTGWKYPTCATAVALSPGLYYFVMHIDGNAPSQYSHQLISTFAALGASGSDPVFGVYFSGLASGYTLPWTFPANAAWRKHSHGNIPWVGLFYETP